MAFLVVVSAPIVKGTKVERILQQVMRLKRQFLQEGCGVFGQALGEQEFAAVVSKTVASSVGAKTFGKGGGANPDEVGFGVFLFPRIGSVKVGIVLARAGEVRRGMARPATLEKMSRGQRREGCPTFGAGW